MPRKAIVKGFDFINGTTTVEYTSEEGQTATITMGLPTDEKGNYIKPEELIKVVKQGYPEYFFVVKNAQRDYRDLEALEALQETEIIIEPVQEAEPERDSIDLSSKYGSKYEVGIIKDIVLTTLAEMGIIR